MTLWGWYISPLFKLPEITIAQAIGIILVVKLFRGFYSSSRPSSKLNIDNVTDSAAEIISEVIVNFFVVLLGWVILQFV